MAKLNIYVSEADGKTISKFGKMKDNDRVVFHNKDPANTLEVSIQSEPQVGIALCDGSQKVESFTVTVAEQKKGFKICGDYGGETFKYTATIQGSDPEDPIIIIERWNLISSDLLLVTAATVSVVTLGVGLYAGFEWAKRKYMRLPQLR